MLDIYNFWGGFFVGLFFAGWLKICFGKKFAIWDARRGWVLKWEDELDEFRAGVEFEREFGRESDQ